MPNIRTFEAPGLSLNPTETGIEATAQSANRVGRFYSQAGAAATEVGGQLARGVRGDIEAAGQVAVQYADNQQISAGAAHGAQLFDALTTSKADAIKAIDPNDPAYGQKVEMAMQQWREQKLEPALQQFNDGFTTENSQRWAEHFIDSTRQHMFTSSAADVATAAKIGITNAIHTTVNAASNTAMNDPSSVPAQIDLIKHSIDGMVASSPVRGVDSVAMRAEFGQKAIEQIVKSGAFGAIQKSANPEAVAAKWASDYPQYINGPEELQLARAAKTQARTNLALQKQTQLYQKQLDELQTHKAANDAFTKNVTIDQTTGRPILNPNYFKDALDIAKNNPNAPNAATVAKTMIDWGEMQQRTHNEVIQTDPATQKALLDRVFDSNNPVTKIDVYKAEAEHKLSGQDGTILRGLIDEVDGAKMKGPIYQTLMDGAKERLGVSTLYDGHERYANFMQSFWPQYIKMRNAGTLPPNWNDLKDPDSLISKSMKAFEPSPAERLHAHMLKSIGGNVSNLPDLGASITGGASAVPHVTSAADYAKIQPGARYMDSTGNVRVKGGK